VLVDAESVACAERFPAASAASTASVWLVPHVSPVKVYEVPVGLPAGALLRYVPYPVTATLSFDAFQEAEMLVWVAEVETSPVGVVGACVSGHVFVDAEIVAFPERFPAASTASTASE
jgi:hypothetical protein